MYCQASGEVSARVSELVRFAEAHLGEINDAMIVGVLILTRRRRRAKGRDEANRRGDGVFDPTDVGEVLEAEGWELAGVAEAFESDCGIGGHESATVLDDEAG